MKNCYASLQDIGTNGANFGLDTESIILWLTKWEESCRFRIANPKSDRVDIIFDSLPQDLDAFVHSLYRFCPDLVDQGTSSIPEAVELLEESGQGIPDYMQKLIEGVNLESEDCGTEILKRELRQKMQVTLWWD